jgi:RecA-family ATPase
MGSIAFPPFPRGINVGACFESDPPTMDFVLPGFLAGTVGGLVSPGGTGKSYLGLELSVAIAAVGITEGGNLLDIDVPGRGRVIVLAGEDPPVALHARLRAIGTHLSPEVRESVRQHLTIIPAIGAGIDLMNTSVEAALIKMATGVRLIVIDTLTRFHCEDENDTGRAKAVMAMLERVAKATGATILFLHHVSKASAMAGLTELQQAARGSSVWVDNARWLSFLAGMTREEAERHGISEEDRTKYVRWNISKQNYGSPLPDKWFRRHAGGILLPTALQVTAKATKKEGRKRDAI